jgi:hypothetical protein
MAVAMADGSIRTVNPQISSSTWNSVITLAGGEILGNDW